MFLLLGCVLSRTAYQVARKLVHPNEFLSLKTPAAFLRLLLDGIPDVVEHVVDSKRDIDMQLKQSCTSLIRQTVASVVAPWAAFVADVTAARLEGKTLPAPEVAAEVANAGVKNAKAVVPVYLSKLRLYLANAETEFILFAPVKVSRFLSFPRAFEFVATVACLSRLCVSFSPDRDLGRVRRAPEARSRVVRRRGRANHQHADEGATARRHLWDGHGFLWEAESNLTALRSNFFTTTAHRL